MKIEKDYHKECMIEPNKVKDVELSPEERARI